MATIRIKHVDTFTTIPQNGNPAAVVVDSQRLTEQQMLSITREVNLNETVFILPSDSQKADIRLRWFTPKAELPMSGHANLAALHVLAEEGKLGMTKDGVYRFRVEAMKSVIPVKINKKKKNIVVTMELSLPEFESASQYKVDLIRPLNITVSDFDPGLSIQRNGFLFAPIRRLHTVFTMKPNFEALSTFLGRHGFEGLCVFTTETVDRNSLVHSRVFAPHLGIPEDPVTGFIHRSLALYLQEKKLIPQKEGRFIFQAEQGDAMGRKGRIEVEILMKDEIPYAISLTGSAVTVMEGVLKIPD